MYVQAFTHGVDFPAAEECLDMAAAHKHHKKVSMFAADQLLMAGFADPPLGPEACV